jgi:hypothetical protein
LDLPRYHPRGLASNPRGSAVLFGIPAADVARGSNRLRGGPMTELHARMVENLRSSALTDPYIAAMNCRPFTREEIAELCDVSPDSLHPNGGYGFPYPGVHKHDLSQYVRCRQFDAEDWKYVGPRGHDNAIYVPPRFEECLARWESQFFCVTEGEKKAAALCCHGIPCLGIGGVTAWPDPGQRAAEKAMGKRANENTSPHPTIRKYLRECKCVIVIADSDYFTNSNVESAMSTFRSACERYQAELPVDNYPYQAPFALLAVIPPKLNGAELMKMGVDDHLKALLDSLIAREKNVTDAYRLVTGRLHEQLHLLGVINTECNDDSLANLIAHEAYDRFAYTGEQYRFYDRQTGTWQPSDANQEQAAPNSIAGLLDRTAIELKVTFGKQIAAIKAEQKALAARRDKLPDETATYLKTLEERFKKVGNVALNIRNSSRKSKILTQLTRFVRIPRTAYDRHQHSFAVANGVLDLRTRELKPLSPSNLITKASPVVYDPSAKCPCWEEFLAQVHQDAAIRQYEADAAEYKDELEAVMIRAGSEIVAGIPIEVEGKISKTWSK